MNVRLLLGGLLAAGSIFACSPAAAPPTGSPATSPAPTGASGKPTAASAQPTSAAATPARPTSPTALPSAGATSEAPSPNAAATSPAVEPSVPSVPGSPPPVGVAGAGVVGPAGMAAWDALAPAERESLKRAPILYLHQSVGQDLEDGSEANGFDFEYFGPGQTTVVNGLNGGIFTDVGNTPNGDPFQKMDVVRRVVTSLGGKARVVSFSFGYADVRDSDLLAVQTAYQRLVSDLQSGGARFVHVTPPLVYNPDENAAKMKMRTWMLETFKNDVIFDLQDIESLNNGQRCEVSGTWRICQENRSTTACPSKGQGIDEDGAGHLCERKAADISKGMLYAFYLAAK